MWFSRDIFCVNINNSWRKTFHDNLTLQKSIEKCWLERDLNSHIRDTGPPLYLLSYRVHRDWRRVFIQFKYTRYSRDNLTLSMRGRVVFRFYFRIILRDIHEGKLLHDSLTLPNSTFFSWLRHCQIIMKKFLFKYISEDDSEINDSCHSQFNIHKPTTLFINASHSEQAMSNQ